MDKRHYLAFLFSAATILGWSGTNANTPSEMSHVMKALPIYSNHLIDKAPEGEKIIGVRDCYSTYYQNGNFNRDFENGVLGEYVVGTDGNIYLRAVCYSAAQISSQTDTYLKLEKVDDTTYVAHTPQLIWVDELSGGTPFTAYATRVIFSQKSATSFGYEVQQNPDGTYDTDVYFTFENGVLKQKNQNTTVMNEEVFAEELIGFTNSTGGWLGFGDGCITIFNPENAPTSLPKDAEVTEKSLDYTLLHVRDKVLPNAAMVKYAEVGDNLYISNPSAKTEQWVKGTIDRANGTVSFDPQYLGIDPELGYAVWFIPTTYDKHIDIFDDETGYGDWFRDYTQTDKLVLKYTDSKISPTEKNQAMFFSHSPEQLLMTGVFADPAIIGYKNESLTPASVTFTKFEEYDDIWGFGVIGFAIPCMDTEGYYINPDELYFNVYPDDSTAPFLFSPEDYLDMEVPAMTDVPYNYIEDFDFKVNGVNHTVYFYHQWEKVGVRVIQKHNGVETFSEIVYSNGDSGVEQISAKPVGIDSQIYKCIENGKIVIVCNGIKYNALGVRVK